MRILIVDDSPLVRRMLKDYLVEAGYVVSEADSFVEAKIIYTVFQPQIIIKDLYMKGCNLIDSIRFFRDMNPQVKIVLCSTGSAESHDLIIEGLKAGASEILLKPLEQKKILELVGKLAVS